MKYRILLTCAVTALSGCATMSVDECAMADWHTLGFEDGSRGETLARAEKRENDCTKHGYAMERPAYERGRHEGLGLYCTPEIGYRLGESGRAYTGVCADHDEGAFLAGYNRGLELFAFSSAVASAGTKLKSARSRHSEIDSKLEEYSGGYRDEGLTMEEHNEMVLGLWAERKYLANEAIPYWSFAHRYLEEELADYTAKVVAGDPSVGSLQPREFPGPDPYTGPTRDDAREMLQEVFSGLRR